MQYWMKRLVSPFHSYSSSTNPSSRQSIQLFQQLGNLDWREAANLVIRRTPLSLWRLANQSLQTVWHSSGVSHLVPFSSSEDCTMYTSSTTNSTSTKPWMITFQTGDSWGAGTDASVWIQFLDENGNYTQRFLFRNSDGSHFCRRGQDSFIVAVPDSLPIPNKIRIGHTESGLFPAWFLKSIIIRPASCSGETWQREWQCNRWIGYHQTNGIELVAS